MMPAETRQQIVDACDQLIQSLGLARVTTKELARKTGLSEGALYRHFDHKEDIFLAVFEQHVRSLAFVLDQHLAGHATVGDHLREIGLAILRYYEHLIPLSASFFADTELLARFRALLQEIGEPDRLHHRIAVYIEEEQRLGRITPERLPLDIATSLLGPVFQYAFLRQLTGHDQFGLSDRQFVENLVQVLALGVLPPGEQAR